MSRAAFDQALSAAQQLHDDPRLAEFVPFSGGAFVGESAHHVPAVDRLLAETGFDQGLYARAVQDLVAPAAYVQWRETYKGTYLAADYLERFACYRLLGPGGPFATPELAGFILYATAALDYPWHHHPAEELYLILGGEAEFQAEGDAARILRPGDTVVHASNQPHRMTTFDSPVLCWVLWRPPHMDIKPVLTEREVGA